MSCVGLCIANPYPSKTRLAAFQVTGENSVDLLGREKSAEDWLGGLDSNQDSQIQSLESYQLDDLPITQNTVFKLHHGFHGGSNRGR